MLLLMLWLVCMISVEAGIKTVGIFTYCFEGMPKWDPDSVHQGISGSEEAVIYLSDQLTKLGYQVTVHGNPPEKSVYRHVGANPRYVDIDQDPGARYDFAVCWRDPGRAPAIKKRAGKVFFWPHDTCIKTYPDSVIQALDGVFWLSQFQRLNWSARNGDLVRFETVFGNGINPEQFAFSKKKANPHSCIYASNYGRGLEVLLDAWPLIKRHFPKATLDIFYGWNSWGLLSVEQTKRLHQTVKELAKLDVKEHGRIGHDALHRAFATASIWAYPCIAEETFCITGLKAQMSEALPAIINHSALRETVRSGERCFGRNLYCLTLMKALIRAESMSKEERASLARPVVENWTWEAVAKKWHKAFEGITEK